MNDSRLEDNNEETLVTAEELYEDGSEESQPSTKNYADYVEAEEQQEAVTVEEEDDDVPEKYRGKSVKDLIAMHQNAEKLAGRQSSEVGELRKVVDDFILAQTTQQQAQATPDVSNELDDLDFYDDPKKAVNQLLENHPAVKQSKELASQLAKQESLARLKATHPDFLDIVQNVQFQEWVGKSKIRQQLMAKADKQFDFDSADELLSLWKERQTIVKESVKAETTERKRAVKQASTGTVKGSNATPSKKIYRRADIVELNRTNPERYAQLAEDIRLAYAEGRVR